MVAAFIALGFAVLLLAVFFQLISWLLGVGKSPVSGCLSVIVPGLVWIVGFSAFLIPAVGNHWFLIPVALCGVGFLSWLSGLFK